MDIIGNRLNASTIEEVKEIPSEQLVRFKILFPTDWGNNIFNERFLTFKEVTYYEVDEIIIPFGRTSVIYEIQNLGKSTKTKVDGPNSSHIEIIRRKFEINTDTGKRTIEFSEYEFSDKE